MARIAFAWEIGARRGHTGPMMPVASGLAARGHSVHAFLRDVDGVSEMAGADTLRIFPAPRWVGEVIVPAGLNLGEVLLNFGFDTPEALGQLVEAWRDRLARADLLVSNVAPAAIVAARTLGLPYLEMSQGYHVPPPSFPAAPFRDWEIAPRPRLERADRRVLAAINGALAQYGAEPIATIGDLFVGRLLLLTYPELEMYPERGPSEYFGIVPSVSHKMLDWPAGRPRILAYLYADYRHLPALLEAIEQRAGAAVVVCPGIRPELAERHARGRVTITESLLEFQRMAAQADVIVCHGSHQTTAEALLAGRSILALPTQVEQFLTTRRVLRYGAGLGIASDNDDPDFDRALRTLLETPSYSARATEFASRYRSHDRTRALLTLIQRCESARLTRANAARRPQIHLLTSFKNARDGTARLAFALRDLLAPHAQVELWSVDQPEADERDSAIHVLDNDAQRFPSGGTLVVLGRHVPRNWLARAWYERTILLRSQPGNAGHEHEIERTLRAISGRTEALDARSADVCGGDGAPLPKDRLEALRDHCLDSAP